MKQLINFDKWNKNEQYAEVGQRNQLRWMNLRKVDENTYEPVSFWWKCKDFMNEVVTSAFTNKPYKIYGFAVNPEEWFKYDRKVYWLLKNFTDKFVLNMDAVNTYLKSQGLPRLVGYPLGEYFVIECPEVYQQNTLFMSQVTLFIRLANCNEHCATMEDMLKQPENSDSGTYFAASMKKPMGKFPKALEKYIWYYDDTYNLPKDKLDTPIQTSKMHNCGVVAWGWK